TASRNQTVRVWNAETGELLTTPLWSPMTLAGAKFLPDGLHLYAYDNSGNAWIRPLPSDATPVEDFRMLANLLTGGTSATSDESSSRPDSLKAAWQKLRARYPSDFTASTDAVAAWHEFQAGASESEHDWTAVAFHLQKLLDLRPDDPAIAQRFQRAMKCLNE